VSGSVRRFWQCPSMAFDHNDHYHPLLMRQLPTGARTALDVGCGSGRFARKLSAAGLTVDAVDASEDVLAVAAALGSPGPGRIDYRHQDVTETELPTGRYDYVSCLASLHHLPFDTLTRLRQALAPGGVLVVLGLARPRSLGEHALWLGAAPLVNVAARVVVHAGKRLNGGADPLPPPPIQGWEMSMTEVRRESARLLPGRRVRPLLFWRYLLTYREPVSGVLRPLPA
jgi:SAM-dependent methyltransferase